MNCAHCNSELAHDARFCGACGKVMVATEPAPHEPADPYQAMVGREIGGRYRITAKLGEGGMGAVFRAEQISLKRAVAVKLLRPEVASSPQLLRRFNAEAEVVAKLSHPNTVSIYDFGQDQDGSLFIAMEFIDGHSLRSALQAGPMPLGRALAIARQITDSLADAHAHAIVHRDLKPDNVMLQDRGKTRDIVRVLDFGIAKLRDETRATAMAMTQAGDLIGTPQYMAPEQIKGEAIDGRTDVYALGCMLYEMITGRMPFEADAVMQILSKHLLEPPVTPSVRRPDLGLPPAIDHLVLAAMAKDPRARPATMEAFGEQLAALAATVPVSMSRPAVSMPLAATQAVSNAYGVAPTEAVSNPYGTAPRSPLSYPIAPTMPVAGASAPAMPAAAASMAAPVVKPVPDAPKDRTSLYLLIAIAVLCIGGFIVWKSTSAPELFRGLNFHRDAGGRPDPFAEQLAPQTSANATLHGATLRDQVAFERFEQDGMISLSDQLRGIAIVLFPLEPTNDDPETLARAYATRMNLDFVKLTKITSHGEERDVASFTGTNPHGKFLEVVIAYVTPDYRIGLAIAAPVALAGTPVFQQWLDGFVERGLVLP